ncbi:hypothetical protein PH210_27275 [Paenibacillus sp. BSR1-1]|uniref:hypothetical protein n=1 Tax=Paenibacillus sp. BSR1-1 TaxID=3020845 RepID=UPI0025B095A8|nr:hypothetical protein [Paenibacillus sp. BSR1-1]MDN3019860.1 hypothetical protein [Paenibacillus sp. BSR1-1]
MTINYNFAFSFQLIPIITLILAWCVIAIFAYRMMKKQQVKPKAWKALVCVLVGLFSFSINFPSLWDTPIKISILPLGVWILYSFLKRKEGRWVTYRRFAWLGFWANFIFLAAALIAVLLQNVTYPKDELSTYMSNVENAKIRSIHPSGKTRTLDTDMLLKQIHNMSREKVQGNQWYYEKEFRDEKSTKRNERFPYQLFGTTSKWGSGLHPIIYLEADGKGILVSAPQKQLYFRSNEPLLKGEE